MSTENPASTRRSALDALRAVTMLLGIVLHAALSFSSFWIVKDRRQEPGFEIVFSAIHGFRMPLFFVMSGFFSAMLLHRRGLGSLVKHRFYRVFLPLLAGMVTIVPATNWFSSVAMSSASRKAGDTSPARDVSTIWAAASAGDLNAIERHPDEGKAPDDPASSPVGCASTTTPPPTLRKTPAPTLGLVRIGAGVSVRSRR